MLIVVSTHFQVVRLNGNGRWGNVFLTTSWTLYIDMTQQQHDAAMKRLGIDRHDVLVSGCIHNQGKCVFRSSPGLDRKEITETEAAELMDAIREIIIEGVC